MNKRLQEIRDNIAIDYTRENLDKESVLEPIYSAFCYGFDACYETMTTDHQMAFLCPACSETICLPEDPPEDLIYKAKSVNEENNKLKRILNNLYYQSYGLIHTWCGMWSKCKKCSRPFAWGGNWNDLTSNDLCPMCQAEEILKGDSNV